VHRTGCSLSRLVVTRDDRGQNAINLPEMLGTGAAAGISSAYYPQQYRNWTETAQRWLINAAFDGGVMVGSQVLTRIHSHDISNTSLDSVDSLSSAVPDRSFDS
jgi:hypothetical protein